MDQPIRSAWLFLVLAGGFAPLLAQEDLRDHRPYFEEQVVQFQPWLEQSGIADMAAYHRIAVMPDKVVLVLKSRYAEEDSLQAHWKQLREDFYQQNRRLLSKQLFSQFAFFLDLQLEQGEILIEDPASELVKVRIYFDRGIQMEEYFSRILASRTINLDLAKIKLPDTFTSLELVTDESLLIHEIRKKISQFLIDYYQDKGARWYRAHVDTSSTFYNSFNYRISCLNQEIIQDRYYEFIEFRVEIEMLQNSLSVLIDINGKYASGILCPRQREKFYTMIDSEYPGKMKAYADDMEKRISELLQGRR